MRRSERSMIGSPRHKSVSSQPRPVSRIATTQQLLVVVAALITAFALDGNAQRTSLDRLAVHVESDPRALELCGTRMERDGRIERRAIFPNQFPMAFDQSPAILTPDYRGIITLRNLRVTGDVASIRFNLFGGDGRTSQLETWTRTG